MGSIVDPALVSRLACPRDHQALEQRGDGLRCTRGHVYPVVDGVPVMLLEEDVPAFDGAPGSLSRAAGRGVDDRAPELHLESISISESEKLGVLELAKQHPPIDPVVAYLIGATNGIMYRHLIGSLREYPIPDIGLPPGHGEPLLDIGCSWGRWTIAAARRGYTAIGIDPSLGAVMAAIRVARQLGLPARYVVGDARHLPFHAGQFDRVFSYSVIQHFSRGDAARAVAEMSSVLKPGGIARVQMPMQYGVRCLYHQARRGFTDGEGFDVRYWSRPQLRRLFAQIGRARFEIDGFFGLGMQAADAHLMNAGRRAVLKLSSALKAAASIVPSLAWVADSVYVQAVKET